MTSGFPDIYPSLLNPDGDVGDLRGDHRPLARVQVPSVEILANNERENRAVPVPFSVDRINAGFDTGPVSVAAVDDLPLVPPDRLAQAVPLDVVNEGVKLVPPHQWEQVCGGMEDRIVHGFTSRRTLPRRFGFPPLLRHFR